MSDYIEGLTLLPDYMQHGMQNWVEKGRLPGSFLTAVLENNLMEATACADSTNRHFLFEYAEYLYNYAPSGCFGSIEKVTAWHEKGGLEGHKEDA